MKLPALVRMRDYFHTKLHIMVVVLLMVPIVSFLVEAMISMATLHAVNDRDEKGNRLM